MIGGPVRSGVHQAFGAGRSGDATITVSAMLAGYFGVPLNRMVKEVVAMRRNLRKTGRLASSRRPHHLTAIY
jgi:hypothetical protein